MGGSTPTKDNLIKPVKLITTKKLRKIHLISKQYGSGTYLIRLKKISDKEVKPEEEDVDETYETYKKEMMKHSKEDLR